jgi:hypothetical protein
MVETNEADLDTVVSSGYTSGAHAKRISAFDISGNDA